MSKRALFCGPVLSEFGWELMECQGYVRAQALAAERVVVCTRRARGFLYADLPEVEIIPHDVRCVVTDHRAREIENPAELERVEDALRLRAEKLEAEGYAVRWVEIPSPNMRFRESFRQDGRQMFRQFGHRPTVVVHIRDKACVERSERNYPADLWERIIAGLRPLGRVVAIGTKADALSLPGVDEDLRGLELEPLCEVLSRASVVVGPSSGPMHLASLCGAPHVVWTDKPATASRYRDGWNPFAVPCRVLSQPADGWTEPHKIIMAARDLAGDPTPQGCGVLYVCTGEAFRPVLEVSIKTLRRVYDGPVTILTDRPSGTLSAMAARHAAAIMVEPVSVPAGHCDGAHYASRHLKTRMMQLSPYPRATLFLDADTLILQPLDAVWGVLGGDAVVMAVEGLSPSIGGRSWGNCPAEKEPTLALCGADWPHYHSSTVLFAKGPLSAQLSALWHAEWRQYADAHADCRVQDQPALARATCRWGRSVGVLPRRYNARRDDRNGANRADPLTPETVIYSVRCRRGGAFFAAFARLFPADPAVDGLDLNFRPPPSPWGNLETPVDGIRRALTRDKTPEQLERDRKRRELAEQFAARRAKKTATE